MALLQNLIKRKNLDEAISNAQKGGLEKTLGAWDLILLGVGAIIGSGIFAIVGVAAAGESGAGPALMISMVIAAIACVFSALCYTEFATMTEAFIHTFSLKSLYVHICNLGRTYGMACRLDSYA